MVGTFFFLVAFSGTPKHQERAERNEQEWLQICGSKNRRKSDTSGEKRRGAGGRTGRRLLLCVVGDEAAAVEEWVGGGSGGGGGRGTQRVVALPGERGAEEGERLAGAGGRLEERVGAALPPRAVQRGDDAAHEGELRPVRLVRELHRHAAHLVHPATGRPRRRRRGGEVFVRRGGAHRRRGGGERERDGELARERERLTEIWAGGFGGKWNSESRSRAPTLYRKSTLHGSRERPSSHHGLNWAWDYRLAHISKAQLEIEDLLLSSSEKKGKNFVKADFGR